MMVATKKVLHLTITMEIGRLVRTVDTAVVMVTVSATVHTLHIHYTYITHKLHIHCTYIAYTCIHINTNVHIYYMVGATTFESRQDFDGISDKHINPMHS